MSRIDRPQAFLNAKRQAFVAAMLAAASVGEAAGSVGVSERTARRWLADPAVRLALSEAQNELLSQVTAKLLTAISEAIETLREVHSDADNAPTARVSAARAILEAGLRYVETSDLARRVTELEELLIRRSA